MEKILGYIISGLPYEGLSKVADLIEYDGPILSHFKTNKEENLLYYWVDQDNNFNRWLIWKISEEQLYDYLRRRLSLRELLLSTTKDFLFSADINNDLNHENINLVELGKISQLYIPEEESFFSFEPQPIYLSLLEKYESNYYLQLLREKAIYFKLDPVSPKFSHTVSATDAASFLKKISSSFLSYLEYDFFERYKLKFTDLNRLNKIVKQFKELLDLRITDLKFSSFGVALSSDILHNIEESDSFKEWQLEVFDSYKHDVVEVDYNSEIDVEIIAKKYPEEIRKKIFSPIIEILNDDDYTIEVSNWKRDFKKKFTKIKAKNKEIIIPALALLEPENEEKVLVQATFEINKGGDIKHLGKKELQSNLLFAEIVNEFIQKLPSLTIAEQKFDFKKPLEIFVDIKNGKYHLESKDLKILVEGADKEDAYKNFNQQFLKLYQESTSNPLLRNRFLEILI